MSLLMSVVVCHIGEFYRKKSAFLRGFRPPKSNRRLVTVLLGEALRLLLIDL